MHPPGAAAQAPQEHRPPAPAGSAPAASRGPARRTSARPASCPRVPGVSWSTGRADRCFRGAGTAEFLLQHARSGNAARRAAVSAAGARSGRGSRAPQPRHRLNRGRGGLSLGNGWGRPETSPPARGLGGAFPNSSPAWGSPGDYRRPLSASRRRSIMPAPGSRIMLAGGRSGADGCGRVGALCSASWILVPRSLSCCSSHASCSRGNSSCSYSCTWCRMSLISCRVNRSNSVSSGSSPSSCCITFSASACSEISSSASRSPSGSFSRAAG